MLDKKQIWAIFLLEFKMSHKAAEKTQDIYNAFGPGTANEMNVQGSGGWRHFAKKTRTLKMRSTVTSHWKFITTNWEQISKLILLQLQDKLRKNSASTFLWLFGIWNKLERWKSLISGCLRSWLKIKKKKYFEVSSLILHNEPFLDQMWDVK